MHERECCGENWRVAEAGAGGGHGNEKCDGERQGAGETSMESASGLAGRERA